MDYLWLAGGCAGVAMILWGAIGFFVRAKPDEDEHEKGEIW